MFISYVQDLLLFDQFSLLYFSNLHNNMYSFWAIYLLVYLQCMTVIQIFEPNGRIMTDTFSLHLHDQWPGVDMKTDLLVGI